MGLYIYYSGRIINEALMAPLIAEVSDICKTLEWETQVYTGINDENQLSGVSFAPEGSEPVFLTMLPGGRLCSPVNLMCGDLYDGIQFDKELMYTSGTKTQYAGPSAHIAIIKLLKYIAYKYLEDFKLTDEGNYWETGDENKLYAQFEKYNFLLDVVGDALCGIVTEPGEKIDSLAERIEKILTEKLKGAEEQRHRGSK